MRRFLDTQREKINKIRNEPDKYDLLYFGLPFLRFPKWLKRLTIYLFEKTEKLEKELSDRSK